ncbi:MAG: hypothetical protein AAFO75_03910, partial [Pseudomonadota bacterium]
MNEAKARRETAADVAKKRFGDSATRTNEEERIFSQQFPTNFTKGLEHDQYGLLKTTDHYVEFVEAVNR